MSDRSFTTTFSVDQTTEEAFGAVGTPGVPVVVDRTTWQAELDALRIREKGDDSVRYRDFVGWDAPWYSAQVSAGALLAGRRAGIAAAPASALDWSSGSAAPGRAPG